MSCRFHIMEIFTLFESWREEKRGTKSGSVGEYSFVDQSQHEQDLERGTIYQSE